MKQKPAQAQKRDLNRALSRSGCRKQGVGKADPSGWQLSRFCGLGKTKGAAGWLRLWGEIAPNSSLTGQGEMIGQVLARGKQRIFRGLEGRVPFGRVDSESHLRGVARRVAPKASEACVIDGERRLAKR